MARLNPVDLYDVRSQLTEDEILIQDSVGRWVDKRAMPLIAECFDEARFPSELIPEIAELGLLGSSLEGYGCAGLNSVSYGLICQDLESVITYEGTETVHQLVVGRELTGINAL